jgi:hypothetical protein
MIQPVERIGPDLGGSRKSRRLNRKGAITNPTASTKQGPPSYPGPTEQLPPGHSGLDLPANEEDVYPIEIRAALPKVIWTRVIANFLVEGNNNDLPWVEGSKWPSVIAVNRFGRKWLLVEFQSKKEATAQVERVRTDLQSLGLRRWCEKYDVPWIFVTG